METLTREMIGYWDRRAPSYTQVIRKNLATVQDIACKLGEHMADTEILLRSIAENYADSPADDDFRKKYK